MEHSSNQSPHENWKKAQQSPDTRNMQANKRLTGEEYVSMALVSDQL